MKSLVFSHVPLWEAHHAEAVEIALSERDAGKEVVFLSCVGALPTCPANPFKKESLCRSCRKQTQHTISKILPKDIVKLELKLGKNQYNKVSEFFTIDDLKKIELDGVPFGMMVYSTLTSNLNDSLFDVIKYKNTIKMLLQSSIELFEYGLAIINAMSIDNIYVWNGRRSSDGPLLYAADQLGIKYQAFISGGRYNSILIRENTHSVQDIESASNDLKAIVHNIENNVNRMSITTKAINFFNYMCGSNNRAHLNNKGIVQFSKTFINDNSIKSLNKSNDRIIAVFLGTYSEYAGVEGYDENDDFCNNFYEGVSFLQENLYKIENAKMIIRWHPNSKHLEGGELKMLNKVIERGKNIKNITHIPPESNFNTYNLIEECDTVIGFGTTVSIEACLYGKPVIFIGHNMFENLRCFYKPTSYDELLQLLKTNLVVGEFNHAIAWGYYFGNNGNYEYKYLEQKSDELFFYDNKPLLVRYKYYRRRLGLIKKYIYGMFNSLLREAVRDRSV